MKMRGTHLAAAPTTTLVGSSALGVCNPNLLVLWVIKMPRRGTTLFEIHILILERSKARFMLHILVDTSPDTKEKIEHHATHVEQHENNHT